MNEDMHEMVKKDLAHIKATIGSLETKVDNVWLRWEPYVCLALGLTIGIVIGFLL